MNSVCEDSQTISQVPEMSLIRLSRFSKTSFNRGRSVLVQCLWILAAQIVAFQFMPLGQVRRWLLQMFGAKIGQGVILKGRLRVRYPWRLAIGDDTWIGEDCWIDNWESVTIGSNVCISQSVYLCTGNHDWTDPCFAIKPEPISIGDGGWLGARAVIGPGVSIGTGAIAVIGSVVTKSLPPWEIYAGNPARFVRAREIRPA